MKRAASAAQAKSTAAAGRLREWVEGQDPATHRGAAVGWGRRYARANGQLYVVLLTAYIFITLVPASLVMATYLARDPTVVADRLIKRLDLTGQTAALVDSVLTGAAKNQLGSTLIAVVSVFFFGIGFGRVLQAAHARSWGIDVRKYPLTDQARYLAALLVPLGFVLVYQVQIKVLAGDPAWIGWLLAPVWFVAILWYLVWAPRMLLHGGVSVRDVLPGAVFTMLGFVALYFISALLFAHWLNWYSTYYGGLGVVMALFFWLMAGATVLILAAALSPALAERRDLRQARAPR